MNITPLRNTLIATLLLSTPLSAEEAPKAQAVPQPQTLVTINGRPITDMEVLAFNALQGKQPATTREAQIKLINQLVNTTLIAQEGEKANLEQHPNVKAAIEMARIQVLAEAQVNAWLNAHAPTDAELQAAYKEKYSAENLKEYKVRHILVQTEEEAKAVIEALDKGGDFAELAKSKSLDATKDSGGELGWIAREQVVKPFGDAMVTLAKGQYTKEPVQSPFGWHVIEVEEVRTSEPPPFEEVKAELANSLRQQKLAEHILELRRQAKIEVAPALTGQKPAAEAQQK